MLTVHMDRSDSIAANVEQWTVRNRDGRDARAAEAWSRTEPTWGSFGIREADLARAARDRPADAGRDEHPLPARRGARRARAAPGRVLLTNSVLAILCSPDTGDVTERPQAGMYRDAWPEELGVEYHVPHGEWIDLLHATGFEVERLIDVYARADSKRHELYGYIDPGWARTWPAEEIWTARKR